MLFFAIKRIQAGMFYLIAICKKKKIYCNFCRPLDEDKKLKEKFDSIFDVGKYDKCIGQVCKEMKAIHEGKLKF